MGTPGAPSEPRIPLGHSELSCFNLRVLSVVVVVVIALVVVQTRIIDCGWPVNAPKKVLRSWGVLQHQVDSYSPQGLPDRF